MRWHRCTTNVCLLWSEQPTSRLQSSKITARLTTCKPCYQIFPNSSSSYMHLHGVHHSQMDETSCSFISPTHVYYCQGEPGLCLDEAPVHSLIHVHVCEPWSVAVWLVGVSWNNFIRVELRVASAGFGKGGRGHLKFFTSLLSTFVNEPPFLNCWIRCRCDEENSALYCHLTV